ncbi:ubiquitin-related domain-containing protein [Tricladium varicosporioides]|nr:ubiquitin-related domain-containing protein [Hymenoscyphus varicosporioides]
MTFKIKYTTKLERVMAAFCKSIEVDPKTRRFHFEGSRILKTDTPLSLEMQNDDLIDVYVEQSGGWR